MRKVEFYIDFGTDAHGVEFTDPKLKDYQVVYTLYGDRKSIDRYELTDVNGNNLSLFGLELFQKDILLRCQGYFLGVNSTPRHVVEIKEDDLVSEVITEDKEFNSFYDSKFLDSFFNVQQEYIKSHEPKSNLDSIISRAQAISEQAKSLADDLIKLKTELEH